MIFCTFQQCDPYQLVPDVSLYYLLDADILFNVLYLLFLWLFKTVILILVFFPLIRVEFNFRAWRPPEKSSSQTPGLDIRSRTS